ncbi:MAG TPA: phosphoenolpyruvate carboxylase [Nocardioidaceae bacterium]|nr:phosphoenolpyruvate carboxylase [Nocardioidaceae bacterium]
MSISTCISRQQARFVIPDELRANVRLLGETLGEVIREYAGESLFDDVERLRELTIAAHGDNAEEADQAAAKAEELVAGWTWERADEVARAFTCYFHLTNIAEEHHRVRALDTRDYEGVPSALATAFGDVSRRSGRDTATAVLDALEFRPVLTAHPTEARRRAVVAATRRIVDLLVQCDDPRNGGAALGPDHRVLREEVDVLWRTAQLRSTRPSPLDEVRTAMTVFDETLFRAMPRIYRRLDDAIAGGSAGAQPPKVPAFVRLGSWIGGDRDGNPHVTAAVTRQAMMIQSEHVLRALERSCDRIGRALTLDEATTPASAPLRASLVTSTTAHPEIMAEIATRSPGEPHRQALLLAARRIAATRSRDADLGYVDVDELRRDLQVVQDSLAAAGARRQAFGELQHLLWQVDTFGFHLAELEIRQHSSVHERALAELRSGEPVGEQTEEVLETLRVIAQIQQRFGTRACRRYVISFTRTADDIAAVYELARIALDGAPIELDVVPLFETEADLERSVDVVTAAVQLPEVRQRLALSDRRYEVMLGYSDSAKDVGPVSATLVLDSAQARLVRWAERADVHLTLFHGRGGALGRGGGPAHRAVLGQAPGSLGGRLKLTEQGEVIFARYGNPAIAVRHVEQVTAATLLASTPAIVDAGRESTGRYRALAAELGSAARSAYRSLVETPGFAEWFAQVTPLEEIGRLPLGSRPAKRGLAVSQLGDLRAIPWVFAWAQARVNLPGWFGLGSALTAVPDLEVLREARQEWPLFQVLLENAEMSLAKTDVRIMRRFLDLGDREDLTATVLDEHARATEAVLQVTGQSRLLEDRAVLGRAVQLRNPYVDALSYLELRGLRALRAPEPPPEPDHIERLLLLAVSGVAAGLQNTG